MKMKSGDLFIYKNDDNINYWILILDRNRDGDFNSVSRSGWRSIREANLVRFSEENWIRVRDE